MHRLIFTYVNDMGFITQRHEQMDCLAWKYNGITLQLTVVLAESTVIFGGIAKVTEID